MSRGTVQYCVMSHRVPRQHKLACPGSVTECNMKAQQTKK
jgi:hypothetical protein